MLNTTHQTSAVGDSSRANSKAVRLEKVLLVLWFTLNLVMGVLTVHKYGVSIDEENNHRYAADTLKAYPSLFGILYEPHYDSSYEGHGPAFITLASIAVRIMQAIFPNAVEADLWHFTYFITFPLAGLCLYWLAKRWFSLWTAWGILMLFSTQPLLLGHSFINPKDTPFMFLLTLSVVLGLRLVDSVAPKESFVSLKLPVNELAFKFQATDPGRRRKFVVSLFLALAVALALILFSNRVNSLISQLVTFFYTAEPDTWAGRLFSSVATHASNLTAEHYATKALKLFDRAGLGLLFAGILFFLAYFGLLIGNTTLVAFLHSIWIQRSKLGAWIASQGTSLRSSLNKTSLKLWFAGVFRAMQNPALLVAAVALGLATAVRAIAPVTGVIVFFAMFARVRSRAWTTTIAYLIIAGIATYLAWPRLWGAPIHRYLEGLGVVSSFPYHPARVLFNGQLFGSRDLPYSYLPVLLNIQLTEPFLLSVYIGIGVLMWRIFRNRLQTDLLLYIGLGFALPLFAMIALRSPLYNNFRQALFLIPAMFMLAAFTLDLIFRKLTQNWARVLLIVAIALPGVYSSIKLFPYEYVYYNSLVGGPAGASGRYEMDYWRISLREAALELNKIAPHGAKILVTRSAGLFVNYTRPDLVVDKVVDSILGPNAGFDYVVQTARWEAWEQYPNAKTVITIERDGAVLTTVKDVKNGTTK